MVTMAYDVTLEIDGVKSVVKLDHYVPSCELLEYVRQILQSTWLFMTTPAHD